MASAPQIEFFISGFSLIAPPKLFNGRSVSFALFYLGLVSLASSIIVCAVSVSCPFVFGDGAVPLHLL